MAGIVQLADVHNARKPAVRVHQARHVARLTWRYIVILVSVNNLQRHPTEVPGEKVSGVLRHAALQKPAGYLVDERTTPCPNIPGLGTPARPAEGGQKPVRVVHRVDQAAVAAHRMPGDEQAFGIQPQVWLLFRFEARQIHSNVLHCTDAVVKPWAFPIGTPVEAVARLDEPCGVWEGRPMLLVECIIVTPVRRDGDGSAVQGEQHRATFLWAALFHETADVWRRNPHFLHRAVVIREGYSITARSG
mmetsp:Transcript_21770/g.60416  ORF Transcript_21770/g.60416 Transcript_21770/m.60416 type:complete len:247 (+) Transcript_21770:1428-2168(+)